MRPALRVAAPGLFTTIQDLGRFGYQHLGIPSSGALDAVSLRAANVLAGNPAGAGALEVASFGPTLVAEADDVRIAIVGAEADIEVLPNEAAPRGRPVASMQSMRLHRGEALRIGALTTGSVLYVAVEGGFDLEPVLGSVSTYVRGGFGGWQGRALQTGDALPLVRGKASDRSEVRLPGFSFRPPRRIRAMVGPQQDYFSDSEFNAFFEQHYTVGPSADRMGMRLTGRPIRHRRGFDITSDGIAPGSVQIPGNGQPIVLLADRQTTGGYPKIATVISADIPAISRFAIGTRIAFERVTFEVAENAFRQLNATLAALGNKLVPLESSDVGIVTRLSECNLISGVIGAVA